MTNPTSNQPVEILNLADVDRVIHEPARLIIIVYLSLVENVDFLFLMQQTGLTFGNLSSHLKKLEDAGYIEVHKEFLDRRPHTLLKLSARGRKAFKAYQKQMRPIFKETKGN